MVLPHCYCESCPWSAASSLNESPLLLNALTNEQTDNEPRENVAMLKSLGMA